VILNPSLQAPLDRIRADQTLVPGLVGLCALSAVEEGHRRDPGVMDRYRGKDAIIILVSPGLLGPPVAPHADQDSLPGEAVTMILKQNYAAPLLVSPGPLGPPVVPVVGEVRGPGAVVMERSK